MTTTIRRFGARRRTLGFLMGAAAGWLAWTPAGAGEAGADGFTPRVTTTKPADVPEDWTAKPVFPEGFTALPMDENVAVDRNNGEVLVAVALSDGMTGVQSQLEFLLISGEKNLDGFVMYERSYESVFTTRARPDPILLACLLAGFNPGVPPRPIPEEGVMDNSGRVEGDEVAPEAATAANPAERLILTVRWEAGGAWNTARVEDFLYDQATRERVKTTPWLFTGSYFVVHPQRGQTLAASLTQVVAATFFDRSALLNLPYYSANTYQEDRAGIILDAESLPEDFRYRETIVEGVTRRQIWLPLRRRAFLHFRKATAEEAAIPEE